MNDPIANITTPIASNTMKGITILLVGCPESESFQALSTQPCGVKFAMALKESGMLMLVVKRPLSMPKAVKAPPNIGPACLLVLMNETISTANPTEATI